MESAYTKEKKEPRGPSCPSGGAALVEERLCACHSLKAESSRVNAMHLPEPLQFPITVRVKDKKYIKIILSICPGP